jgi:uncharacterized membrane protein
MYSKAKIFGHPIHPMLVGFPVAFYAATLVAFIAYGAGGDLFWFRLGVVANAAAVIMAAVAAVPGFIDWAFGIPGGTRAKSTGLKHMLLNVSALVLFAINLGIYAGQWNEVLPSATTGVILSALGMGVVLAAGFLGWNLVQKHHVGVEAPNAEERLEATRRQREYVAPSVEPPR